MQTSPDQLYLEQALALHQRLPVVAGYIEQYGYDSLFRENGGAQCDLEKIDASHMRACGLALANGGGTYFAIGPNEMELAGDADWALAQVIKLFDTALRETQRCPRTSIVRDANDLADMAGDALRCIPLVVGHHYMRDLTVIGTLFRHGMRISHPGIGYNNDWCRGIPNYKVNGNESPTLTDFGRDAVAYMNELGIVLDMAHMSDESTEAIIEVSSKPVVDGHTGSRTLVPGSRGHSDATLKKIADNGGVAGIHFADHLWTSRVHGPKYPPPGVLNIRSSNTWAYNRYILKRTHDPDERLWLRNDRTERNNFYSEHHLSDPPAVGLPRMGTLADMADHLDHLVNVMGIEHVGLGGDVNGITSDCWPVGMDHVGELPHLTAELLCRGYSEDDLTKFLSANWLRVFRECLPQ